MALRGTYKFDPTLTVSGEKSPSLNILMASGVNLRAFREMKPWAVLAVSKYVNLLLLKHFFTKKTLLDIDEIKLILIKRIFKKTKMGQHARCGHPHLCKCITRNTILKSI